MCLEFSVFKMVYRSSSLNVKLWLCSSGWLCLLQLRKWKMVFGGLSLFSASAVLSARLFLTSLNGLFYKLYSCFPCCIWTFTERTCGIWFTNLQRTSKDVLKHAKASSSKKNKSCCIYFCCTCVYSLTSKVWATLDQSFVMYSLYEYKEYI